MFGRLKLGQLFGIDVYLHWSFFLLVLWVILSAITSGAGLVGALATLALVGGVFGCVVLHELGHALAARRYGVGTHNITLYPIGGVANLTRIPRDPKQELVIALAGPAVNVVIAIALAAILFVAGGLSMVSVNLFANSLLLNLLAVNIIMIVFNMLPAFPMDGGRVFRAILAMHTSYVNATRTAASVGKFMAFAFGIYAVLSGAWTLLLIALFVYFAAEQERRVVEATPYGQWPPYPAAPHARHNESPRERSTATITPEIVFHPTDRLDPRRG